jgi:hydroxymethylpyrimidine/phosphomethylpyrimidine kinase
MNNVVLSVGGFDPTSHAGIITDSVTSRNIGIEYVNLISALTVQNSKGLFGSEITPEEIFHQQFEKLLEDYLPKAIKTGMLPAKYQIDLISDYIRKSDALLIVDPVKDTSSGGELVTDKVYGHLVEKLLPISYLVTPNIPEGEYLAGKKINDTDDMVEVAQFINEKGPYAVYLKGGHLSGDPVDILSVKDRIYKFRTRRKVKNNIRGTGCKFASAVAAYFVLGEDIVKGCEKAKEYIDKVITNPEEYY